MFWAEAVATEVRSVVAVMPVTRMSLTPRLKRVWRRINKAKGPPTLAPTIPRRTISNTFGDGRKYDLRVPGVRRLEPVCTLCWYASLQVVARRRDPFSPLWVKSGKAQNEHITSALPPKADIRSARLNEYTP